MLTEEEKVFLDGYSEKIRLAVRIQAGAIPVRDLERMAEIWRREKDRAYAFRPWCGACKMDLLRKMKTLLDDYGRNGSCLHR